MIFAQPDTIVREDLQSRSHVQEASIVRTPDFQLLMATAQPVTSAMTARPFQISGSAIRVTIVPLARKTQSRAESARLPAGCETRRLKTALDVLLEGIVTGLGWPQRQVHALLGK